MRVNLAGLASFLFLLLASTGWAQSINDLNDWQRRQIEKTTSLQSEYGRARAYHELVSVHGEYASETHRTNAEAYIKSFLNHRKSEMLGLLSSRDSGARTQILAAIDGGPFFAIDGAPFARDRDVAMKLIPLTTDRSEYVRTGALQSKAIGQLIEDANRSSTDLRSIRRSLHRTFGKPGTANNTLDTEKLGERMRDEAYSRNYNQDRFQRHADFLYLLNARDQIHQFSYMTFSGVDRSGSNGTPFSARGIALNTLRKFGEHTRTDKWTSEVETKAALDSLTEAEATELLNSSKTRDVLTGLWALKIAHRTWALNHPQQRVTNAARIAEISSLLQNYRNSPFPNGNLGPAVRFAAMDALARLQYLAAQQPIELALQTWNRPNSRALGQQIIHQALDRASDQDPIAMLESLEDGMVKTLNRNRRDPSRGIWTLMKEIVEPVTSRVRARRGR